MYFTRLNIVSIRSRFVNESRHCSSVGRTALERAAFETWRGCDDGQGRGDRGHADRRRGVALAQDETMTPAEEADAIALMYHELGRAMP